MKNGYGQINQATIERYGAEKNKLTPEERLESLRKKQLARDEAAQKAKEAVARLEKEIADKKAKAQKALDDGYRKNIVNIFNKYGALSVSSLDIEAWLKSKGFNPLVSKKGSKAAGGTEETQNSTLPEDQEEFF